MATGDITLFHELKVRYPEIPDDVLKTRMKQVRGIFYSAGSRTLWIVGCKSNW